MNSIFVMALIGICLGAGLIVFTVAFREKLPSWSVVAFMITGVLIALSGILMMLGTVTG